MSFQRGVVRKLLITAGIDRIFGSGSVSGRSGHFLDIRLRLRLRPNWCRIWPELSEFYIEKIWEKVKLKFSSAGKNNFSKFSPAASSTFSRFSPAARWAVLYQKFRRLRVGCLPVAGCTFSKFSPAVGTGQWYLLKIYACSTAAAGCTFSKLSSAAG